MKLLMISALLMIADLGISQEISIKNNELFEFLYNSKKNSLSISSQSNVNRLIPQSNKNFRNYNQIILKNKNGLYILIDGTGIVYKAKQLIESKLEFERIDSTHFYGYNANGIIFSSKDTIFSFAGGGFWRINGQLRYFNNTYSEWNIIPISEERAAYEVFHFYNEIEESLFYLQVPFVDPVIGKEYKDYTFFKLNLRNLSNDEIGKLDQNLSRFDWSRVIYVNLPNLNGSLIGFAPDKVYFISFKNNMVYQCKNKLIKDAFWGRSDGFPISNLFAIDNKVFYTEPNDSLYKLHSFEVSMNDFIKEPYSLYKKESSINNNIVAAISAIIAISGILFFLYRKQSNKNKTKKISSVPVENNELEFNGIEIDLISKMIESKKLKKDFSVDDINNALGLSKKSLEIQKKVRTESINRINHKFKVIYDVNFDLIERIRSVEDRRYYNYIISDENAQLLDL